MSVVNSFAPWTILAAGLLIVCALLLCIAIGLFRLAATQRLALAHAVDVELSARRNDTRSALADIAAVESLAAQLVADAFGRALSLRADTLVSNTDPAPYFSVTDVRGVRYFFTTSPVLFCKLRIVHPRDPLRNVSRLSTSARADTLAMWEALLRIKQLTHTAVPCGADWHVIAYRPVRAQVSLRALLTRRRRAAKVQPQPRPAPHPGQRLLEAGR